MPLLRLEIAAPVEPARKEPLIKACSRVLAETTGKPESYVMVTLTECAGSLGSASTPLVFADVRGIGGLDKKTNVRVSKALCDLIEKELGVPPSRVYLNFTDVPASNWGWKGTTFG